MAGEQDKKTGSLFVDVSMSGDQFPAAEVIIGDNSGQRLIVGGSAAVGGSIGGPTTMLPGNNQRPMMRQSMQIRTDSKGNFLNVRYNGGIYSLKAWNEAQKAKPNISNGKKPRA